MVVVCVRMAQGLAVPFGRRHKMGEIRVDRGWPGVNRLVGTWSRGRVAALVLPTTTAFHSALLHKKMSVRGWGRGAGARARTNALFDEQRV